MNDISFLLWLGGLGFLAIIVLPGVYIWLLRRMRREQISCPPQFELFVGFGTLGGWLLLLALAGIGPLIITLPVMAFQILIAVPGSLICVYRLGLGAPRSSYHSVARWLLACGVMLPLGIGGLGYLVGMR